MDVDWNNPDFVVAALCAGEFFTSKPVRMTLLHLPPPSRNSPAGPPTFSSPPTRAHAQLTTRFLIFPFFRFCLFFCLASFFRDFAGFASWCLVASWVTGTYSHVDRLWSITPAVYAVVYAAMSGGDARCIIMATFTCVWGVRLTYNFARKGGYSKGGAARGECDDCAESKKTLIQSSFQ